MVPEPLATGPGVEGCSVRFSNLTWSTGVHQALPEPAQAGWVMPPFGVLRWSVMGQGRRMTCGLEHSHPVTQAVEGVTSSSHGK